jgi:hypothetical protein
MRLLGTIELARIDAFSTPVGAQGGGEPLFDKAPAHALDRDDPSLERLGNALVRPARSAFGLIGLEQDLSVLDLANIGLATREQPLQLVAFVSRERHPMLLGHDRLLVSIPAAKNAQTITSALADH